MATAEKCLIREMISYHRLSGRSIFQFIGNRSCIRLETFYNKSYKESYYILYSKRQKESDQPIIPYANPLLIEHHTIPHFIHLDTLQKQFLPHNFDVKKKQIVSSTKGNLSNAFTCRHLYGLFMLKCKLMYQKEK
jgi:hypothetical protein